MSINREPTRMRHPDYYLGRAEETRIIAGKVKDPSARQTLLDAAADWEKLGALVAQTRHRAMWGNEDYD